MSKNLRVFLLSVLVVVLGVSSAMAALPTYRIMPTDRDGDGFYDVVDVDGNFKTTAAVGGYGKLTGGDPRTVVINTNGRFTFDDTFFTDDGTVVAFPYGPIIDNIILDGVNRGEVTNTEFVIPAPFPKNEPGQGTAGQWLITWPANIKNNLGLLDRVTNSNRVTFTISKKGPNSAILPIDKPVLGGGAALNTLFRHKDPRDNVTDRIVKNGWNFVLEAPIRVNPDIFNNLGNALKVEITVNDGGKMVFGEESGIYADYTIPNVETGYAIASALASKYVLHPGGELEIKRRSAIMGSALDVDVWPGVGKNNNGKRATLTFDLPPSETVVDLRGIGAEDYKTNRENDGTTLKVDGNFNVVRAMTLYGEIITRGQYDPDHGYIQDDDETIIPLATPTFNHNAPANRVANSLLQRFFKTGEGHLTLSNSSAFETADNLTGRVGNINEGPAGGVGQFDGSLSPQLRFVDVLEGTLEFGTSGKLDSDYRTWWAGRWADFDRQGVTPTVTVAEKAAFIANTNSIVDDNAGRDLYDEMGTGANVGSVAFVVNGTATFKHHAIVKREKTNTAFNEIYPYEDFLAFHNGILINARDVSLTIGENGKVIVDNGAFAAGKIAGKGTIEIKDDKDPSRDVAVLILTEPFGTGNIAKAKTYRNTPTAANLSNALADEYYARSYIDFEGTITGGNVGLFTPYPTDIPFSRRIFSRAKSVSIKDLIVYGDARLNVAADTKLSGVQNIWLRSHRPGAKNYKADGKTPDYGVAYSKLRIGKLNFVPRDVNSEITNIKGLKVDATSSYEDMGAVIVLNEDNDNKDSGGTYPKKYDAAADRQTRAMGPRLDAYITNLQLYANAGPNRDFPKDGFLNPDKGIYALRLNNEEQPSRIYVDGTTVTGNGLQVDVTNKVYQIELTRKSDVRFTGYGADSDKTYEPVAKNNSIRVKQDAKLEIDRGATVNGHLIFEPSSNNWFDIYGFHDPNYDRIVTNNYPADEDFISDEGWYDGARGAVNGPAFPSRGKQNATFDINSQLAYDLNNYLNTFTTFTTQVGAKNREMDNGGEYAVKVTGDLTLASDLFTGYSGRGRVLVRTKADLDSYKNYDFTSIGETFLVLGEAAGGGEYTKDFATSFNHFFLFRIPTDDPKADGIRVKNRDELAFIKFDNWSFLRGEDTFGKDSGYDFEAKVPFKLYYRGEEVTIERDKLTANASRPEYQYYVVINGHRTNIAVCPTFFGYGEGMSKSNQNVSDITALTTLAAPSRLAQNNVYDAYDGKLTVRGEFVAKEDTEDGVQYIRVIGKSSTGDVPAKIRLATYLLEVIPADPAAGLGERLGWMDGVVPGFDEKTFSSGGVDVEDPNTTSKAVAENASQNSHFTVGDSGNVSFKVTGVRHPTYDVSSAYSLVRAGAVDGTYYMLDGNGKEVLVKNLKVVRYNGDSKNRDTGEPEEVAFTSDQLSLAGNVATITLPVSALGSSTGGKFSAIRGLALKAERADGKGTLITAPVNYTLHANTGEPANAGSQTITQGEKVEAPTFFDVNPKDVSGNIEFIYYDVPEWITMSKHDNGFSYTIGDTSNVAPGTYTVRVLAYSGDDAATNANRKLYEFTVKVEAKAEPGIVGVKEITVSLPDGKDEKALALVGGATGTFAVAPNSNPASLLTLKSTGSTTATVVVNATGVAAGQYVYTITAGEYSHVITVKVTQPELEIEEVYNGFDNSPLNNYTYYATYKANGATGDVTWTLTDNTNGKVLHSAKSGDLFVVEGTVKAMPEDAEDTDQSFVVKAVAGTQKAEQEVTFSVDPDEQTYTSLAATSGTHDAVAAGYKVDFPAGVKADSDNVFLPSWLKPVLNDDDEVVGIAFAGPVGDFAKGTKATVRILATNADGDDVYYGWDVVYGVEGPAPAKLALKATPATLDLAPSATGTVTLEATDAQGDVTYTADKTWAVISGTTATITAPATEGTYEVTFTATDSRGEAGKAEAKVTVKVTKDAPVGKLTLTTDKEVNLYFGTETGPTSTITLTTANALGSVTYDYSVSPTTGLTVAISGNKATLTGTESGEYTVTFKATDAGRTTDNTATFTTKVTVSGGALPEKFSLSVTSKYANGVTFDISRGTISLNIADVVNPVNNQGTVSYTATSSSDGLKVVVSGNTATVTATKTGKYTVTIKGTDAGRTTDNTATATISVTVTGGDVGSSSGGGGCDAGFGALALALAAPLFLRRRRS